MDGKLGADALVCCSFAGLPPAAGHRMAHLMWLSLPSPPKPFPMHPKLPHPYPRVCAGVRAAVRRFMGGFDEAGFLTEDAATAAADAELSGVDAREAARRAADPISGVDIAAAGAWVGWGCMWLLHWCLSCCLGSTLADCTAPCWLHSRY